MRRLLLSSLALTAVLAAAPVAAQQRLQMSTYLGAAGGVSGWNLNCSGTTSCQKTPASGRIYAGYKFTPSIGIEASVGNLGAPKVTTAAGQAKLTSQSMDVSAVFHGQLGRSPLSPFAKVGLAGVKTTETDTFVSGAPSVSSSRSKANLLVGVGMNYSLSDSAAVRVELDMQKVDVPGGSSGVVTTLQVGGQAQF